MKVRVQILEYTVVDIKFPFYAKVECDTCDEYVMISKDCFKKIVIPNYIGTIEFSKNKRNIGAEIAHIWYKNKCSKQEWDEALSFLKRFVRDF